VWPCLAGLLLLATQLQAAQRLVELDDGTGIPVETYPAEGDRLLLRLPSEFGLSPRQGPTARQLAERGIEVWIPDLHSTWFIPPGRYSLNDVDPGSVQKLLEAALGGGKKVYLLSTGRVMALALHAIRRLQQNSADPARLRGLVGISPRLYIRTPQGGQAAEFLPVASASNIPLYLLQPEEFGAFWRIGEVMRELEKGGSPVYLRRLPEVSDGFHLRTDHSPAEATMTQRLPGILDTALQQLDLLGGTPATPAPMRGEETAPQRPEGSALLRPYPGERQAPPLRLPTLEGTTIDLASLRGRVVLVNFWTTWCPPCVEEIPSLQRLYAATRERGLEILAVDVGESPEQMREFLADKSIDFPVLMDTDASAFRAWGVHAFPTTLVLDRAHRIRYAVFGAFKWDSAEVLDTLEPLLGPASPAPPD
jgi:peroxiredoxin